MKLRERPRRRNHLRPNDLADLSRNTRLDARLGIIPTARKRGGSEDRGSLPPTRGLRQPVCIGEDFIPSPKTCKKMKQPTRGQGARVAYIAHSGAITREEIFPKFLSKKIGYRTFVDQTRGIVIGANRKTGIRASAYFATAPFIGALLGLSCSATFRIRRNVGLQPSIAPSARAEQIGNCSISQGGTP